MNNPLRLFHNLLFNSDLLNPTVALGAADERISLFGEDITDRIRQETGRALLVIDDTYWIGSKSENEYFLSKLLNITGKLVGEASSQLEKHIEHLVMKQDLSSWLVTYNNTQCAYENLIAIRSRVLNYYCNGCVEQEDKVVHQKKFPFLLPESAVTLREICVANVGKQDTEFTVRTASESFCIAVATAKMPPVAVALSVSSAGIPYADDVYVPGSQRPTFVWNGKPKEFVQHILPLVDSKKLFINESCDRTPLVNALHEIFQISTVERGTKGKKVISLDSLQTYFKKEASGDIY